MVGEVQLFFKEAIMEGGSDSNSRPKTHVLPSTPYAKALVCWPRPTGKTFAYRLLPELTLVTTIANG